MRFVIVDVAAKEGGALNILKTFYEFLISFSQAKSHEWYFLLNDNYFPETDNIKVRIVKNVHGKWINRLIFDSHGARRIIRKIDPDVIFSLQNTVVNIKGVPQVLYVHQAIPFQTDKYFSFLKPNEFKMAIYQYFIGFLIKKSVIKADHVIVQAKWIKEEIVNSLKLSPNVISAYLPPIVKAYDNITPEVYSTNIFFYPTSNYIYKNNSAIFQACSIINDLDNIDYQVNLTLSGKSRNSKIYYTGRLDSDAMVEFYKKCTLIFPSYIETVGLPLIEAMQFNSIILVADTKYSREILKDYVNAFYFDHKNPKELSNLMLAVIKGQIKKSLYEKTDGINKLNIKSSSWEPIFERLINMERGKI